MGLLDSVIGAMGQGQGGGAGGGNADLLNAVIGMLGAGGISGGSQASGGMGGLGGLIGLVQKFQQGGLGHIADSWVSTGQNLPVSGDQLGKVLGQDTISNMAGKLGMNQGDLLGQLAQMLPQVVDKLTPNGQLPEAGGNGLGGMGGMGDLAGMLGGLLNKR
jgi:uncharacterized protein YidB (DUF937 family)